MTLTAVGLSAGYSKRPAIHDISVELKPSSILSVVGANGAGKSTLAKALAGDIRALSGSITVDGKSVTGQSAHSRARLGIILVPEGRRLFPGLTVAENIALGAIAGKRSKEGPDLLRAVQDALPAIRELSHRRAGLLSGGEQQMVALMRAAAANPRYLILDEPSLGLSPRLVEEVFKLVELIARESGAAILLIEQLVERALHLADSAIVLQRGRIIAQGTGAEMRDSASVQAAYFGG